MDREPLHWNSRKTTVTSIFPLWEKGDEERADIHFWRRQLEAAFARTKETGGVRMDGQPLVLSQEDVRVILPRTEIEKLSDEVHEIEIWLGKGEERQR